MWLAPLACFLGVATPFERLAGEYRGPMNFINLTDGRKEQSFPIDLRIVAFPDGISTATKYRFAPNRYSLSVYAGQPIADGTQWRETGTTEGLTFDLTGWQDFASARTDWFEMERATSTGRFKRRWTLTSEGIWSEKWLKTGDGPWEFNHKMELKRVR